MRPSHAGKHHAGEHRHQFAGVGREQVEQIFLNVVVDAAALFDGLHDAGEVVIGEHDVGGFFRHVRPGDAHGDADICRLQGGGVVDAVAGHGDDMAFAL